MLLSLVGSLCGPSGDVRTWCYEYRKWLVGPAPRDGVQAPGPPRPGAYGSRRSGVLVRRRRGVFDGLESEPYWTESDEAVLRHHLTLPPDAVDRAVELAAQDGYTVSGAPMEAPVAGDASLTALVLQRTQVLDAMHCAQEKSRMVSLAQRLGGTALGWDALQPPVSPD